MRNVSNPSPASFLGATSRIPHPRIAERAFVLKPLAEIAPNHLHPVVYYTMQQMLQDVDDVDQVKLYTPEPASEMTPAGPAS